VRRIFYFNFSVKWPKHVNFSRPMDEGLEGTVNFYLNTQGEKEVRVGVWHILPSDMIEEAEGMKVLLSRHVKPS